MNVLIRFISRLESGAVEHHDRAFVGESLTLGRATNQDIHLRDRRVALEHAEIRTAGGGFEIVTRGVSGITVNDSFCRKASLAAGDIVYVGSNILRIIEPPAGFDFAFTFELDPDARAEDLARVSVRDELSKTALNKRVVSWVLLTGIVAIFLVIPLLTFGGDPLARMLRSTPAPDDKLWLSGPLHPAHQLEIGDDCTACHDKPFVRVRDSACLACHTHTTNHAEDQQVRRCRDCHKEHNEPAALVLSENSLCADCHDEVIPARSVSGDLLPAGNFADAHPQFRVTLLEPDPGTTSWQRTRIALDDPALGERSGLKFPHDKHLDPEGVPGPDATVVLECSACHVAEQGGEFVLPVRMDDHCHGCHTLEFDELAPGRAVPHAPLAEVRRMLGEFYAARLLTGRLQREPEAASLRIPGETELSPAERRQTLEAAQRLADEKLDALLENVCTGCHSLGQHAAGQRISPVRFNHRWMPKAHFSHASHEAGLECVDCHAAPASGDSADVLMPKIDDCRECHRRNFASTCTDCHGYHLPGTGLMSGRESAK